jgi:hypothetical protein
VNSPVRVAFALRALGRADRPSFKRVKRNLEMNSNTEIFVYTTIVYNFVKTMNRKGFLKKAATVSVLAVPGSLASETKQKEPSDQVGFENICH